MATKKLLKELAYTVVEVAKDKAPEVTGALKRSIGVISISENEPVVGHTNLNRIVITHNYEHIIYPVFVHEGTAPHIIEPKIKKSLGWGGTKGNREYFAKRVKHPGTKAQPYFDEAIKSPKIDEVISKYGDDVVKELSIELDKSWKKK
jgi:hypothetical protein